MIVYRELEAIIIDHCRNGFNVLEIGGEPGGYLKQLNHINLIRTNIRCIKGLDCVADGQKLPFKSSQFDMVFMVAVDYYVPSVELCFSEVHRVLKPNGYFINATYKEENLKKQIKLDPYALRALSVKDHLRIYREMGFDSSLKKIANNSPTLFLKRLVWKCLPRFVRVGLSSWSVFVSQKL